MLRGKQDHSLRPGWWEGLFINFGTGWGKLVSVAGLFPGRMVVRSPPPPVRSGGYKERKPRTLGCRGN